MFVEYWCSDPSRIGDRLFLLPASQREQSAAFLSASPMRTSPDIDDPPPSASPVELPRGHGGGPAQFLAGSGEALQLFVIERSGRVSMRVKRVALRVFRPRNMFIDEPVADYRYSGKIYPPAVCLKRSPISTSSVRMPGQWHRSCRSADMFGLDRQDENALRDIYSSVNARSSCKCISSRKRLNFKRFEGSSH
jgi:hypothetical protein